MSPDPEAGTTASEGAGPQPPPAPRRRSTRRVGRLDRRTIGICVCVALLAALVAALMVSFATGGSSTGGRRADTRVPVGQLKPLDPGQAGAVPGDLIQGLVGPSFRLSDFAGKPVVINFFSTTCGPCVKEMPGLEQVHQRLGAQVELIGIDVQDTVADGRGLVARTGVTYRTGYDPQANLLTTLQGQGLPTTVLVGADGKVAATRTGALEPDELVKLMTDKGLIVPSAGPARSTTTSSASPTTGSTTAPGAPSP